MRNVPKYAVSVMVLVVVSAITFFNLRCGDSNSSTEKLTYLNHHDTVSYVGMDACRACHNSIYESFIQTGMGQSFNVASRQKSAAEFGKHQVVFDKWNNLHYYPFWKKDSMYIMEFRLQGKDTVYQRTERVDYIIGSGQHTNSHMMNVNGYIYQLPLTWYAQKRKWDLPPGFENGQNPRFTRAIGVECMSCHNAMPTFDYTSANKFESIPKGIDCERCHGPGELHVREKAQGNLVDTATQIDYTIVNPKKLSWELQIDVCQRCHLQGNAVLKNGKQFTDFRPGKKLSDYIDIYMPKYEGKEDEFIMASHAQRLQMSKCFGSTEQATKLTCISCHNPHVSVKVTGTQIFNKTCNNCHNERKQNQCTAPENAQAAVQFNCTKCHMPKSGTIDIPHVTVTDHWIRKPATKAAKETLKKFAGIYCINNKQSDVFTRAQAYISYVEKFSAETINLDSAEFYLKQVNNDQQEVRIHLSYIKQDYAAIRKLAAQIKPAEQNNGWLCYRVGRAYALNNAHELAKAWYKQAVNLAPNNLDFMNALGGELVELNEMEEANKVLMASLTRNPKQAEPLTNMGFMYAKQQQFNEALAYYNKALKLDPDYEQALLNKAAVCMATNNKKAAKELVQQVLKRNPNQTMANQLLDYLK